MWRGSKEGGSRVLDGTGHEFKATTGHQIILINLMSRQLSDKVVVLSCPLLCEYIDY